MNIKYINVYLRISLMAYLRITLMAYLKITLMVVHKTAIMVALKRVFKARCSELTPFNKDIHAFIAHRSPLSER